MLGRQRRQPLANGATHPLRDRRAGRIGRRPATVLGAGAVAAHHLVDEEGVALGLAINGAHHGVGCRAPGGHADDESDLGLAEAAELEVARLAGETGDAFGDGRLLTSLDLAIGADQQHARLEQLGGDEFEQAQ